MNATREHLAATRLEWEGTEAGLEPILSGEGYEALLKQGERSVPALVAALDDEGTFVKAHVLLTEISGVTHPTFPTWNGLEVEMRADGEVRIDPSQRHALTERWKRCA
jgi:hypothetical protein